MESEKAGNVPVLDNQLVGIGNGLPLASAAMQEMAAKSGNPVWSGLNDFQDSSFLDSIRTFGQPEGLHIHQISRHRLIDQNRPARKPPERMSPGINSFDFDVFY